MKISRIESLVVDLPMKRTHKLAVATLDKHAQVLVRLVTESGVEGWGEIPIIPHYSTNAPGAVKSMIDEVLAPPLLGRDPRSVVDLLSTMDKLIKGNGYAKAGIEMACLDVAARALSIPVSSLLGGATVARLPVLWILGNSEIGPDIDEAERLLAERLCRLFLVKLGKGAKEENVSRALAIKQALGDRASVRVDANQGWDEATATWVIERLEAHGIDAVEQPVPAWNRAAMRRLSERFTVPIMADEAVGTLDEALAFAAEGAADAFSIKPVKHGGLYRARQVAAIAEAAGISLFGGTLGEGCLGTSACVQVFATFPALAWGCQLTGPKLFSGDVAQTEPQYEDFELVVPTGPGFGITPDDDKLRFYSRR